MKKTVKNIVDRVIQLYMENDYEYVVNKAKTGIKLEKRDANERIQFLKRNEIVPADMSEEDIREVDEMASRRIDEIDSKIYKIYLKK